MILTRWSDRPMPTVWVNFGFVLISKLYVGLYASVGRTVVMNILFEMEDFRLALEAADAGLWQWDYASGKVKRVRAIRETARLPPELKRTDYMEFLKKIHPDDRDRFDQIMHQNQVSGGTFDVDFRPALSTAGDSWIRLRGKHFSCDGKPAIARGILTDITRHKIAEAANNRFAAIINSSEDAIVGKTLDGIITDWNCGAEILLGYTAAEMIGQTISLLLPEGQMDDTLEILNASDKVSGSSISKRAAGGRTARSSTYLFPSRRYGIMLDICSVLRKSREILPPRNAHKSISLNARLIYGRSSIRYPTRWSLSMSMASFSRSAPRLNDYLAIYPVK